MTRLEAFIYSLFLSPVLILVFIIGAIVMLAAGLTMLLLPILVLIDPKIIKFNVIKKVLK